MSEATVESVREAIRANVVDPEIGINIIDLGLVYDVQVQENKKVIVEMTLTSPGCPLGPQIIGAVQKHVKRAHPTLETIDVKLVWSPMWGPERMSESAKEELGLF